MYTREQHNYRDGIPDNYSGIAMGESGRKQEYREHIPEREREQARDCPPPQRRGHPSRDEDCDRPREDCPPLSCDDECTQKGDCQSKNNECFSPPTMDDGCFSPAHHRERDAREDCGKRGASGVLSSLFRRLGFDGGDSTELIILFAALLLMSGDERDDDSYIWLLLLFLLIK